jgi:hypothetical protein
MSFLFCVPYFFIAPVQVFIVGERIGEGIGRTRREAQRQAAEMSLRNLASKFVFHAWAIGLHCICIYVIGVVQPIGFHLQECLFTMFAHQDYHNPFPYIFIWALV